jgi:outer membrane protein assembly factor BamB
MYSSPTIKDGRLFIGDRAGLFHCLCTKTGGWIWWKQTSRARNRDVNATAIVRDDLAIVAANSGLAVGFEAATGRQVWRTKLDGPATNELCLFQRQVLVATGRSVYLLKPSDGEVIHKWGWKAKEVKAVATANEKIFVVVQGREKSVNGRAGSLANESARLICFRLDRVVFEQAASPFISALRWDRSSENLYESRIGGFGIIDGRTGVRTHEIKSRDGLLHPGLVDIRDGIIYLLSMKGVMYALRHP